MTLASEGHDWHEEHIDPNDYEDAEVQDREHAQNVEDVVPKVDEDGRKSKEHWSEKHHEGVDWSERFLFHLHLQEIAVSVGLIVPDFEILQYQFRPDSVQSAENENANRIIQYCDFN